MENIITIEGKSGCDRPFLETMRLLAGSGKSMIDLCSLTAPLTRLLSFEEKTYVDIIHRDLGQEQHRFIQADVLGDHECFDKHYDVAICSDGIEHLHKDQGLALLERMKKISTRQVLFTPLHGWMVNPSDPHPESHKSVWTPADLPDWAHVVVPQYHITLERDDKTGCVGAFWFWNCPDIDTDFQRLRLAVYDIWKDVGTPGYKSWVK